MTTTRTVRLEVELDQMTDPFRLSAENVVGIMPSDIDPIWDEMRVAGRRMISRAFDPGDDIVTNAPIPLVTMTGEALVTMNGEALVTTVGL